MTARRDRRGVQHEEQQQKLLIEWRDRVLADIDVRDTGLEDLWHIPNGGGRSKAEAGIFKAMGTKPGVPDLELAVPRFVASESPEELDYGIRISAHLVLVPGLYIEMKAIYPDGTKSYPKPEQRAIHERLRARGYRVEICWTWDAAANALCDHLDLPDRVRPMAAKELKLT